MTSFRPKSAAFGESVVVPSSRSRRALATHIASSCRIILLGLAALSGQAAFADSINAQAVYGQVGSGEHRTRSVAAGVDESFRTREATADSHWDVIGEAEASEWYVSQNQGRKAFTQVGVTPVGRYTFGSGGPKGLFVELGVGLNWIVPHYRTHDHRFSTAFNFGDHGGVGVRFGDVGQHEVSLRFEHFSNAGIKNPNPGIDFGHDRYAWHF